MAQHHHALNLPEVIFGISRYLESLDDVVACSLVCKSFRASFEPYLWMNIHLKLLHGTHEKASLRQKLVRNISLGKVRGERDQGQEPRQGGIVQGLQRIAPWIRSLAVHDHCFPRQLRFSSQCTGINTLLLAGVPFNGQFDEAYWDDCETLLTQNSACLRSLTLRGWSENDDPKNYTQPLWKPFATCAQHTNLTTLRIRESRISARDLEVLWKICLRLEILELTEVSMNGKPTRPSCSTSSQVGHGLIFEEQFSTSVAHSLTNETSTDWSTPSFAATTVRLPKLRELTLDIFGMDAELQLEQIILHCPQLQILIWNTWYLEPLMRRFCDHLAVDTWPCLDWIEIKRERRRVTEQEHALLLQSAPRPFRRLNVDIGSFGEQTFNLYRERGHFTTLTKIDLTQSASTLSSWTSLSTLDPVASKQVQEVLESCPMLEHIVAMVVTAQDIIQGKPWVCHRLKTFRVTINMEFSGNTRVQEGLRIRLKYSEDDKVLCHQIFERLGQLSQLTLLDMRIQQDSRSRRFDTKTTSLPLRLRMGLGHLSTLRNLEIIGYYGSQRIRLVDLEWMLQHWNKLQKIAGDPLSVKWSGTLGGKCDERSDLVMRNLRARDVQVALDVDARPFVVRQDLGTYYGSDSESERE